MVWALFGRRIARGHSGRSRTTDDSTLAKKIAEAIYRAASRGHREHTSTLSHGRRGRPKQNDLQATPCPHDSSVPRFDWGDTPHSFAVQRASAPRTTSGTQHALLGQPHETFAARPAPQRSSPEAPCEFTRLLLHSSRHARATRFIPHQRIYANPPCEHGKVQMPLLSSHLGSSVASRAIR